MGAGTPGRLLPMRVIVGCVALACACASVSRPATTAAMEVPRFAGVDAGPLPETGELLATDAAMRDFVRGLMAGEPAPEVTLQRLKNALYGPFGPIVR